MTQDILTELRQDLREASTEELQMLKAEAQAELDRRELEVDNDRV